MLNISRKRLFFSLSLFVFLLLAIWFFPKVLFLNFSQSIPRGLYLRVPFGKLQVGDIVAYIPPDDVIVFMKAREWLKEGQDPVPFLKYVGALPGDIYFIRNHMFFINGARIGEVLVIDGRGQELPQLSKTSIYEVPKEEFLPLASNPHGFDGRYTGCVPIERIIAKVIPVWVVY